MKNKKKFIVIGIIVLVVIVSIISNVVKAKNQSESLGYEVGKIEKQTLRNSISCSGNVRTEESKNVTSVLVGNKITAVNVKVGDVVEVGDSLVTFDTETLRKTANDLASSINAAKEQTNISINTADRAVQDAENARNTSLDSAKTAKDQAQAAFDQATQAKNSTIPTLNATISNLQSQIATYVPLEQKYNSANEDFAKAQIAVDSAKDAKETLQKQRAELVASLGGEELVGGNLEVAEIDAKLVAATTALTAAEATYATSQTNLTQATNAFEAISSKYESLKEQIASANAQIAALNQAVDQTWAAYDQAVKAYNNASANLDSAILSAKDAAASTRINAGTSTLTLEEQLTATNKQLAEGNLKSTVSGTVTSVNVKKGDTYQGGTLLTIEGVDSFIIEANIDEYDVADIHEGMEAIIKTDATREEELSGKVIFVAPSSNESVTSSGASGTYSAAISGGVSSISGATYLVKIEVITPSDRLRLGMSAKVSIITEKAENVLTVPYDAITEKEDGTKVITVINDDDTQTEIEVEVGLESGYYSEIKSDKISEGMKIVLPEIDGSTTLDDLLETMGATGGIE